MLYNLVIPSPSILKLLSITILSSPIPTYSSWRTSSEMLPLGSSSVSSPVTKSSNIQKKNLASNCRNHTTPPSTPRLSRRNCQYQNHPQTQTHPQSTQPVQAMTLKPLLRPWPVPKAEKAPSNGPMTACKSNANCPSNAQSQFRWRRSKQKMATSSSIGTPPMTQRTPRTGPTSNVAPSP